jgi:hypothetical protein
MGKLGATTCASAFSSPSSGSSAGSALSKSAIENIRRILCREHRSLALALGDLELELDNVRLVAKLPRQRNLVIANSVLDL